MRLEKIKLAGFKSFVDPTTAHFPSNLVGVVGPNGCGKSNVIDAVRWVMGESSAKMLRGESMADVIFNGSTGRKPVGMASIEMVFDNADGRAGGEFAAFSQIAVKRQVTRDGQSVYFLNGSRCRRKDIQDLFLGTGLGPRSYAIIEQGMISRIIEARPEDLRVFLEEAAGISKYKERRRETETRIRNTRENLDRLTDLRDEVAKQLQHLERQADTAARYTEFRAEERRLDQELKAMRWRALDQELDAQDRRLGTLETDQAGGLARQRRIEADIEDRRAAYSDASEHFNQVQGRFYAVGSEIARAEQAIQFANESRGRREAELVRLDQELDDANYHLERDLKRLAELDADLARDEPLRAAAQAGLDGAAAAVALAEDQQSHWEGEWDRFNQEATGPGQQAQVERAGINALEQRLGRDRERLRRLEEEAGRLDLAGAQVRVEELAEREEGLAEQCAEVETRQAVVAADLVAREAAARALTADLDRVRTALQQGKGRRASLQALQQDALTDRDKKLTAWLVSNGLAQTPRLADRLQVGAGWESAVETVLGAALKAVPVSDLRPLAATGLVPGLVLIDTAVPAASPGDRPATRLAAHCEAPWPLDGLLGPVETAADLAEALGRRAGLAAGEWLITRDGIQIGSNWLRTPAAEATDGVLARAESLKALELELAALTEQEQALTAQDQALRAARAEAEQVRAQTAQALTALNRELAGVRAELTGSRARLGHLNERQEALAAERADLASQCEDAIADMEEARERLHELLEEVEQLAERREQLTRERETLRTALTQAREAERNARDRAQGLRVGVESNRAAREATLHSQARAQDQQVLLRERRDELEAAIEESVEPLAEQRERLDEQLVRRVEVEAELTAARERLESLDQEVRSLEQERHRVEQAGQTSQRELDVLRLERQERLVRRRTLEEQLKEVETTPEAVLRDLDPAADEATWQERLTKLAARIQRLGAINLAAIDEYKEQSERKRYLDEQHADIARALDTLEGAIRKIDRETRTRFKDTYDQVNSGFQLLFPRLFGGGHAYLELTDDDLLETGVTVMARPPGKRNSSIHLLSGGEKALTAVALVFAIFQLNPAPFCMLDEVDAPLDDANVGRFCELVRSLSNQVQFIFISHNKVTMEIADHLLGVTMHEPGVSRLVSVDVEEAAKLAGVA
ncbi:chromosome segregation protein SMC [uncultured Thiodictyon sp.]|uniref:chromosome segregation protein SMC n=1 Tax=uncultured Thiodictyon sp. TaxID=1846217 RepID=UPI0025E11288|nr:chromosome segregation protein SMC [uncultured Thiodictyon sp.]